MQYLEVRFGRQSIPNQKRKAICSALTRRFLRKRLVIMRLSILAFKQNKSPSMTVIWSTPAFLIIHNVDDAD